MSTIAENIANVRERISRAAHTVGRDPQGITLMAVSKTRPASAIRDAWAAGLAHIGENYLQEALDKIDQLQDLPLVWHFIGPIQSNKTRAIAEHFDWVHSVDRLKVAQRLSQHRPPALAPLNICLQVNISNEDSKSGVTLAELPALATAVADLPNLRLRGLMAIPAPAADSAARRQPLQALREAMLALDLPLDTLSMGMSDDLTEAVQEGATIVRIGSALFGARDYSTSPS
ncbi:alanine racemase domain-containing protein [Pseudomonas saudimassiliensis]|uniref:Pyridoxal phosphate homeostasis protein n=1 Tax=Pseudomonas saudimassiliensis TaxID=1461581 RepID=A0A078MJM4_9PSED|nr:YggS family pyridoxal phosphate-dependent enzyme [Pseudomonas saudimassiliensis]CEA04926.1 alanine racemase domain-containing protein [Pseudomonas saudimassiliensis]CEF26868.1 alanine racemase domain-containing protein [Pseudomonas saudimassiliensis]